MRALLAIVLTVPLAARAAPGPFARALELDSAAGHAQGAAKTELLAQAAALPWPTVPPALDQDIGAHLAELPANARRAWALDRALPILAGVLAVPSGTEAEVLGELRAATPRSNGTLQSLEAARQSYAHDEMARAAASYARVTKDSPLWPEALRERAWALLVLGEKSEALGATVSLSAPYFPAEDEAEARLLEATVLLSKCRYREARGLVAPLVRPIPPPLTETAALQAIDAATPPAGSAGARAFASPLVGRVSAALADRPASLAGQAWRAQIAELGAKLLMHAYAGEREAARGLTERALDVRYESLRSERKLLGAGYTIAEPRPPKLPPLSDDQVAWSFDGTYWRDELGTYRYAAGNACPETTAATRSSRPHAIADRTDRSDRSDRSDQVRLTSANAAAVARLFAAEGATLQELVSTTRGDDQAEALLRLGAWNRSAAERLRQADGGDDAGDARIDARLDAADAAFTKALPLASTARQPELLFELGDLRRSRKRMEAAAQPLTELVAKWPNDPLAVSAATALGDDAFDANRLALAVRDYQFARAHARDAGARAYASFKLAWCDLNLEEYAAARSLFAEVIALGAEKGGKALALGEEARRDLVLALARDGSVPASTARARIGELASGDRGRRYLEAYARLISGAGRDPEAASLLASLEPGAKAADLAGILTTELQIATRRRDLPTLVRVATRLADTCEVLGHVPKAVRDAGELALRVAAVTIHGEGRAANDPARLRAALSLYRAYFRAFDSYPDAYDLHHHAGELLMSLHRPAEAERQYTAAVAIDLARLAHHRKPGKWLADSAHGAVFAAQDAMQAASSARPAAGGAEGLPVRHPVRLATRNRARHAAPRAVREKTDQSDPTDRSDRTLAASANPTPLAAPEAVFVGACDRYLRALPHGPDAVQVAYQRALVFYRHRRFAEAFPALSALALDHPADPTATFAARLALDSLRQRQRYADLAKLAARFEAQPKLAAAMSEELDRTRQAALLANAEQATAHDDDALAAARYLAFARAFPRSPKLDLALFNAAAALTRAGELDRAVLVRARLLAELPRSPLVRRARQRQLDDLVLLGRFAQAERLALALAEKAKGREETARLHDAIVFAEAAGRRTEADALREKYLREHRWGADATAHAMQLAEHARGGCWGRERAWTKALGFARTLADRARLLDRLARVEDRCRSASAKRHAAEAAWLSRKVGKDDGAALDASADAALLLVKPLVEAYAKAPLRPPYQRTIPRKLALLARADRQLARVVQRGRAAPAACALVQSGLLYANFAQALSNVRAPRGYTRAERTIFEDALAKKAQPLDDRAVTTLQAAFARARDAGVEPACVRAALPTLARLRPELYGQRADSEVKLAPPVRAPAVGAEAILARAPDAPDAWLIAAESFLAEGRPAAALLVAGKIDRADPLYANAAEVEARALDALGKHDEATAAWFALARAYPARPLAHRVLADRLLALRDFAGAEAELSALHAASPDDSDVAVDLAVTERALGQPEAAEKLLRAVLARAPGRLDASLDLGLLLCADAGKPSEGFQSLETFTSHGGRAPDAARYQAAFAACQALAKTGGGR